MGELKLTLIFFLNIFNGYQALERHLPMHSSAIHCPTFIPATNQITNLKSQLDLDIYKY